MKCGRGWKVSKDKINKNQTGRQNALGHAALTEVHGR